MTASIKPWAREMAVQGKEQYACRPREFTCSSFGVRFCAKLGHLTPSDRIVFYQSMITLTCVLQHHQTDIPIRDPQVRPMLEQIEGFLLWLPMWTTSSWSCLVVRLHSLFFWQSYVNCSRIPTMDRHPSRESAAASAPTDGHWWFQSSTTSAMMFLLRRRRRLLLFSLLHRHENDYCMYRVFHSIPRW